tara:strand:+ start:61 stop:420 length:360 start_codon:yes stop_codon:yes gene_type:complete
MQKYSVDSEKVEFVALLYKSDWHRMSTYDQDTENITWHVTNCMNYIILLSEDVEPTWQAPPDLKLVPDEWNEYELLSLYQDLLAPAIQAGYMADAGMVTRIKKALRPRRYRAGRRVRLP